jgi:hypothetical protein
VSEPYWKIENGLKMVKAEPDWWVVPPWRKDFGFCCGRGEAGAHMARRLAHDAARAGDMVNNEYQRWRKLPIIVSGKAFLDIERAKGR